MIDPLGYNIGDVEEQLVQLKAENGKLKRGMGALAWLIDSHYIRSGPEGNCRCDVCKQWAILADALAEEE